LISARKANLNLEGINLNGYLGALTIGNIQNGADITTLATSNPLQKTRINALSIGDGTNIIVGAAISNLTAVRIGVGKIDAPSIGRMVVRGQSRPVQIVGDMASDITVSGAGLALGQLSLGTLIVNGSIPVGADIIAPSIGRIVVKRDLASDITISGANVDPAKPALVALRVVGNVIGSDIMVNGNVGTVTVGSFRNSRLFAGYTGADDGTGTFALPATVGNFRSTGRLHGFQDSRVIATNIKLMTITNLDSDNSDSEFGVYADTSVGAISVVGPTVFKYNPLDSSPQGVDDFWVILV
jgi:hypothetical protein